MSKPTIHFSEQGHSVFVVWTPEQGDCPHRIGVLSSGDFEVTCCHAVLDTSTIKSQIRVLLARQQASKKLE
jgi:hypothetical protein